MATKVTLHRALMLLGCSCGKMSHLFHIQYFCMLHFMCPYLFSALLYSLYYCHWLINFTFLFFLILHFFYFFYVIVCDCLRVIAAGLESYVNCWINLFYLCRNLVFSTSFCMLMALICVMISTLNMLLPTVLKLLWVFFGIHMCISYIN